MQRLSSIVAIIMLLLVGLLGGTAGASMLGRVTGGGTATFDADLDGDGRIDGSQFAVGVVVSAGGSARGRFTCLMAGRSRILGLGLMAVHGDVTAASVSDGQATLTGTAKVLLTRADHLFGEPAVSLKLPFTVTLLPGGPGQGMLELTVHDAFDGAPGDTMPGDGDYTLPPETVTSGRIALH